MEITDSEKDKLKLIDRSSQYLDGPSSRGREFLFTLKVMWQFIKGFRHLHFVGPCITVFGSARFQPDHPHYKLAYEVGKSIAKMGFVVMTGGGPGVMEAANKGSFENGGHSIGCNIKLPMEQKPNPYMHKWITFDHFFVRKVLLLKYSYAFIVLPGGLGTMDELFETLTLIQTAMIHNFPVVLMGLDYYTSLGKMLDEMVDNKTISKSDLNLLLRTDDMDEAIEHIRKYISKNYKVQSKKPIRLLLERR